MEVINITFFLCLCVCVCVGPATWAMATSKPDILMVLLSKLTQEGDRLYKVTRLHTSLQLLRQLLLLFICHGPASVFTPIRKQTKI